MRDKSTSTSLFGNGDHAAEGRADVTLYLHNYRYFPYERELARREIARLVPSSETREFEKYYVSDKEGVDIERLRSLTYFAEIATSQTRFPTLQHQLEESHRLAAGSGKRQATRYSVHGLHEYKGRFNPQLARFLLHYLAEDESAKILDPFCGSGTALVEASLGGHMAVGIDMNPLAVFLCNAKLQALIMHPQEIAEAFRSSLINLTKHKPTKQESLQNERLTYLEKWFPSETLTLLESLRISILAKAGAAANILLSLVSDLLRDYSLQEPSDLRIRRRICPLPEEPFIAAFERKGANFLRNLVATHKITGSINTRSVAVLEDSRDLLVGLTRHKLPRAYDLVITSPPYSTALPYIDTQRLSLVWLGLCSATELRRLDSEAVGSRETRRDDLDWRQKLLSNSEELPPTLAQFCRKLNKALTQDDGFRRQAGPTLIYRYFVDMKRAFFSLSRVLRKNARVAIVVGANHTTLGGQRFDIDTPRFLRLIAQDLGYRVRELIALQTYQRYGLHQKNSIQDESLIIFEWP